MHRSKYFVILIAALLLIPNLGLGLAAQQAPGGYGEQPPPAGGTGAAVAGHDGNGPFGPPLNPDSTFSEDSNSPLDEYIYNDDQISNIEVTIGRVLGEMDYNGRLIDSESLIANGILAPKAVLHILAWDVDVDYQGTDVQPEIDQVYLNGEYLGNLTGANDTWSISSFDFDSSRLGYGMPACDEAGENGLPSYLLFCSSAPYAIENSIEIIIDSANSKPVWGTEIDWAAISFEAARPTLFVHGRGGHVYEASGIYPASGETFDPGGLSQAAWVNPLCFPDYERNTFGCQYWDRTDSVYFFNFRGRLAQYGLLTQITENELVGENSTLTNAELLAGFVKRMKQRYGIQKINIVAHGKGGLDARAYISDPVLNAADDIAALITLSSPHQGSYLASLASDLPFFALGKLGEPASPALGSVTEAYISDLFNVSHAGRWDVAYYSIGGDAGGQAAYGSDMPPEQVDAWPFLSQQAAAPWAWSAVMNSGNQAGVNNGQVSAASANLAGAAGHLPANTIDLGVLARNHHSMRAALSQTGVEDNTVVELLESVLDITPGHSSAGPASPAAPANTRSTGAAFEGAIGASQAIEHIVGVDSPSTVSFILLWKTGDLELNLIDPGGGLHNGASPGDNVSYIKDAVFEDWDYNSLGELFVSGKVIRYHVAAPLNGDWKAQVVSGPEQPPSPNEYLLLVSQESQVSLALESDAAWYPVGSQVRLRAKLGQAGVGLAGAQATAQVVTPTGMTLAFDLYDDGSHSDLLAGDGEYTNVFDANEFGIYRLSANASGTAPGGISYQRSAVGEVQVASGTAALGASGYSDGGIDLDGDGLYDKLEIQVPVTVNVAGEYLVSGVLEDSQGSPIAWANGVVEGEPGSYPASLRFSGEQIWTVGTPGPYQLSQVRLVDRKSVSLPVQVDFLADAYVTGTYDPATFEHENLEYLGSSDYGVDTNGNGKFDWLAIDVDVRIEQAGMYQWSGTLKNASGRVLGRITTSGMLAAGANTLSLQFPGQPIFMSHMNGPYFVNDLQLWGESGMLVDNPVIATQAYYFSDFEPAPEIFFPFVLGSTIGQLVNGNFEEGAGIGWTEYSSNDFPLIMSDTEGLPVTPHSGHWVAWLGGLDSETSRLYQEISIPVNDPTLSFWYWSDSSEGGCYFDFAYLIIDTNILWRLELCDSTETNGWEVVYVDLGAYAGQTVMLEFQVLTDSSLTSSFIIDDVDLGEVAESSESESPPLNQVVGEFVKRTH